MNSGYRSGHIFQHQRESDRLLLYKYICMVGKIWYPWKLDI